MSSASAEAPNAAQARRVFLVGIDLEDVRTMIPDGDQHEERVPINVHRLLDFFSRLGVRCTFFTVGNVARAYPELIREIQSAGHEIACHSSEHVPLVDHDRDSFRADIEANLRDLADAGAEDVCGFRAPILSMTPETDWAHDVLGELGVTYSSSIFPVRGPMFGWPDFGPIPRRMPSGVWELPVSPGGIADFGVPFAGGVYFRILPSALIRLFFERRLSEGLPVVSYLHPFDIDTEQERFQHPKLNGSRFKDALMYLNRGAVLDRLEALIERDVEVVPCREFVRRLASDSTRDSTGDSTGYST